MLTTWSEGNVWQRLALLQQIVGNQSLRQVVSNRTLQLVQDDLQDDSQFLAVRFARTKGKEREMKVSGICCCFSAFLLLTVVSHR